MGWGALKRTAADLREMSIYEAYVGLFGYQHHHGKGSTPPLSKEEMERRKAAIRKLNIPGVRI